jgi:hypothetical protein
MLLSCHLHSLAIPILQIAWLLSYSVVVASQKFVLADHNMGSGPTEYPTTLPKHILLSGHLFVAWLVIKYTTLSSAKAFMYGSSTDITQISVAYSLPGCASCCSVLQIINFGAFTDTTVESLINRSRI